MFTTAFDREVSGNDLSRDMSESDRDIWEKQINAFQKSTEPTRTKANLQAFAHVDKLLTNSSKLSGSTVVSIIIDHSGSLKGQRAIIACLLIEIISDFLSRLGVRYEILGYTTSEWRGGQSRKQWISRRRPPNPGRLNDLLHIRYRDAFDTSPGPPWSVYNILRSDILKENIDGEALFWASERLKNLNSPKNQIVVISDGAPVDDSTLQANSPDFLFAHLKAVIKDVSETPGFRVAGIGVDYDVSNLYPTSLKITRMDQTYTELPDFLGQLFD